MKTTTKRFAPFRTLLAVAALAALPLLGCTDAGDEPAGPTTSPSDTLAEGITVDADDVSGGGTMVLVGSYHDANLQPVEGVSILCYDENQVGFIDAEGAFVPYFVFGTNPTLTDGAGNFSVIVFVNALTPPGSYTLTVATSVGYNGPSAKAYASFKVLAGGVETVSTPTVTGDPTPEIGSTVTYVAAAESNVSHVVEYRFTFNDGSGEVRDWSTNSSATHTWSTAGDFTITVEARCQTDTTISSTRTYSVSVAAETVSLTGTVTGPAGATVGVAASYGLTLPATSSVGHAVEYQFNCGNGTVTAWSASSSASCTWLVAGTYTVSAQARCATDTSVLSGSTPGFSVTVNP